MFVVPDMSKVQDDEVGDGTTSVTVLAAELLRVKLHGLNVKIVSSPACCSFLTRAVCSAGGGASDCQEDSPTDHHRWLEEGDSGSQRCSEGGGCGSQVRRDLTQQTHRAQPILLVYLLI